MEESPAFAAAGQMFERLQGGDVPSRVILDFVGH
jgi:hypothetical protein